jgi:hypothetical protein
MPPIRTALLLAASLLAMAACRPAPIAVAPDAPVPTPALARGYTQFSPGVPLDTVRTQLGLDKYEARYRSSLSSDLMGVIYFLDDGNLHIEARKVDDAWVLLSVPLLDPSDIPAADRVAAWDRGADKQDLESKGKN